MKNKFIYMLLFLLSFSNSAFAVDIAPRISDREIVEKLVILESGQAVLDQRITGLDQRITDLRSEMKTGQDALGKRIDDMHSTLLAMFAAMMTLIVALFAYIAWDRRTMLKPVVERLDHLEREVMRDLDLGNKDGSVLIRLVQAMRALAKDDEKVAAVLRSFSLL